MSLLRKGAHSIDEHFLNAPLNQNIPAIMGLIGVWNMSFLGYSARTILPYSEALLKLPAHIQQLDMEVSQRTLISNRYNNATD
jgi:glucose-6-phosphate isomerase